MTGPATGAGAGTRRRPAVPSAAPMTRARPARPRATLALTIDRSSRPLRRMQLAFYLDGGLEMAPKPPYVRSAPAEPWRRSGLVDVVRGASRSPPSPHTFAAPRRSRGAALG